MYLLDHRSIDINERGVVLNDSEHMRMLRVVLWSGIVLSGRLLRLGLIAVLLAMDFGFARPNHGRGRTGITRHRQGNSCIG